MFLLDSFQQRTSLGYLALIRIAVGYHFVTVAWPKVTRGFSGEGLAETLLKGAPGNRFEWHRDFIVGWVVPNADWISYVVAYGELAIGASLLAGCLVRVASVFGAFHNVNIYLAVATGAQVGLNRLFILLHVIFIAAAAGRAIGLDAWLHRRFPRSPLF